jgi:hypothetical protein
MNHAHLAFVHRLANNPLLNLASGLILLLCGALESLAIVCEGVLEIPIGAHHGIIFFGLVQMLKALPDTMKALRFVDDGDRGLVASHGHVAPAAFDDRSQAVHG